MIEYFEFYGFFDIIQRIKEEKLILVESKRKLFLNKICQKKLAKKIFVKFLNRTNVYILKIINKTKTKIVIKKENETNEDSEGEENE